MCRFRNGSNDASRFRLLRLFGMMLIMLFAGNLSFTRAQSYYSVKLEALGSEIPADCLPSADSIFECPDLVKHKSIVVSYNDLQEISHLGISLFSAETKELINLPVCNFIERMMLELVLETSVDDFNHLLDRLKLDLQKNGSQFGEPGFMSLSDVLDEIQHPVQFSLLREDDKFAAVWKYKADDQFVFTFPASRELILGTDKKESDELLNKMLFENGRICVENNTLSGELIREADLSYNQEKDIFTRKGVEFLLAIVNSSTYYQKSDENAFELVFSKDFPAESFTNLVLKNMADMNHNLHVTHRMYGNFSPDFDISLHEFLCYFKDDFELYAGVSFPDPAKDPKKMKLTAILRNKEYSYSHLLLITATEDSIFSQGGLMTADFYSNLPQRFIPRLIGDITNNK